MSDRQPRGEAPDLFERTTRWAGDLDHPFYDDERNRWVWFEASAIGFQIALVGSYAVAGIVLLILGNDSLPWVLAMMAPVVVGSLAATAHAQRHGAGYAATLWDFRRSRGLAAIGTLTFFLMAIVIAGLRAGSLSTVLMAGAGLVGFGAALIGQRRQTRLDQARLDALDTE